MRSSWRTSWKHWPPSLMIGSKENLQKSQNRPSCNLLLRIFCTITLHTSQLGKGTLQESQLTFKRILFCPLILWTLSIRDGSRLGRECLKDYFGSLLTLGQILHLPFLLPLKSLQRILRCSRSNSGTFCNTLALLKLWHYFTHTRDREVTDFAVFSDSSFAPSGKHSQSRYTIHLFFANAHHLPSGDEDRREFFWSGTLCSCHCTQVCQKL